MRSLLRPQLLCGTGQSSSTRVAGRHHPVARLPETLAGTRCVPSASQSVSRCGYHRPQDTGAEKIGSFERINSIRETKGSFDSCNSCKWTSCMSQNFLLFHVSNLSVLNFPISLLMYSDLLCNQWGGMLPFEIIRFTQSAIILSNIGTPMQSITNAV